MEEQRVRAGAGPIPSAHLGFVDAVKGLGILAVIWGHMDYLWSTSSVWFSSFKLAVFFVVVGLLKARRYEARGQEESCGAVWGKRLYSLVIPYGVYSLFWPFWRTWPLRRCGTRACWRPCGGTCS